MLPYLEAEGWAVMTVDCAGVVSYMDFARRLVKTIDPYYSFPEGFNMRWASEEACLIRDRDMRQGLFVLYKNFEQLFTMADDDISACANILEEMDTYYSIRPIHGSGLYKVLFGWGFELSQESLSRVEEFFVNRVVIAADGLNILGQVWRSIRSFSSRMVFRILFMKMEMTGLMILMSTLRALPIPAAVMGKVHPNKPQYSIL